MSKKIAVISGLLLLVINQILLLRGDVFIQSQQPIDYARWALLIGVLLCLPINTLLPRTRGAHAASAATSLGIVALVGQAAIDFTWWTCGEDLDAMNQLAAQVLNEPSIRMPFFTLGPTLFYLGILAHASRLVRGQPVAFLAIFIGVALTGIGSFVNNDRTIVLAGHAVLAAGVIVLLASTTPGKQRASISGHAADSPPA